MSVMSVQELRQSFQQEAAKVVVGQERNLDLLFTALLCGGNVLLEGVPGTAKTLMAKALAYLVGGEFKRIQFTPDLMPSDVVGTSVFDLPTSSFHVRKGPIFANVVLADEINRAPAKTQAALLEAMEEHQVTIEGTRHILPPTFMVIATQNPVEYEGTYPLPEAQLDRFFFKVSVDYSPADVEVEVLRRYHAGFDAREIEKTGLVPVLSPQTLETLRADMQRVVVEDGIYRYITSIAESSRRFPDVLLGGSPRASIALLLASRAWAVVHGQSYVSPDDVKEMVLPVYRHRVILKAEAEIDGVTVDGVMKKILSRVEVPR